MHTSISFLAAQCLIKPREVTQVGHTAVPPATTKTCKIQAYHDVTQTHQRHCCQNIKRGKTSEKAFVHFALLNLWLLSSTFPPQCGVIKPAPYLLHSLSCKVIFSYLSYLASPSLFSSISFYIYFTQVLFFTFPFLAVPPCPLFLPLGHTPTQATNHLILAVPNQPCQSCHPSACASWALLPQPGVAQLCAGSSGVWAKS